MMHRASHKKILHDGRVGPEAPHRRQGSLVVEIVVCSIMLGVVTLLLVPSLQAVSRQRQAIRFETLAMIELNNLYQRLLNEPDVPETPKISQWFQRRYPSALLAIEPATANSGTTGGGADVAIANVQNSMKALRLSISRPSGTSRPDTVCSVVVWTPADESMPVNSPEAANAAEAVNAAENLKAAEEVLP